MCQKTLSLTFTALLLLTPIRLYAGGPPRLTFPVDGVSPASGNSPMDQLQAKLASKTFPKSEDFPGVEMYSYDELPYVAFYFKDDVRLSDLQSALKVNKWSVPLDRTHLFGHVILEIDPITAPTKDLLAALDEIEFVNVVESETKDGLLLVTVDLPYPTYEAGKTHRETIGWDKFERNEYSTQRPTTGEPPASRKTLPTYNALRDVVAKHKATLKDIRWSTEYACRAVGAVADKERNPAVAASSPR